MKSFIYQELVDSLTGKKLHTYRHACGLMIKILPRPGFSRKFAAVSVPFGAVHHEFKLQGEWTRVPAGCAHFLEHCLFTRDDEGGLMGRLTSLGASANAYTAHTHTLYYFTAVDHFADALDLYLDALLNPYLEQDRVESERPVIQAELSQYRDDPDTRLYNTITENLYLNHPVREDIGGTAESVSKICDQHLKAAWQTFYQPDSIALTLAGDFDEVEILDRLANRLAQCGISGQCARTLPAEARVPAEPSKPAADFVSFKMDVATPSFLVGVKDPDVLPGREIAGRDLVLRQRTAKLVFDTLLSPVSELYEFLFNQGLVNDSFGFHYACESNYAFMVCGGESDDPKAAAEAVRDGLISHFSKGLDCELFDIQKKAAAGDFVRSLDSVEHSGLVQAQCNIRGIDLFDYPLIYDSIDCAIANKMMTFLKDPSSYTIALLLPAEVEET